MIDSLEGAVMRLLAVYRYWSEKHTPAQNEPTLCIIAPTDGDSSSPLLLRSRIAHIVVDVTSLVGRTSNCLDDGLLVGLLPMRLLMTNDVTPCGAHRDGTAAMQASSNSERRCPCKLLEILRFPPSTSTERFD